MKIIIVGGGHVGSYIARLLISDGHEVRVVEHREEVFVKLQKELPREAPVFGSGTNPEVLEKSGIADADVVAAITGKDEINLVVSLLAKEEYGVPRVVARVNNPKNSWLFSPSMGVDVGINQADLAAHFIVEEMDMKQMFTLMKLDRGDYCIVRAKVMPGCRAAGKPVRDLSLPQKAVLIAVTRGDSILIPRGGTELMEGDDILALTDAKSRGALTEVFC